MIVRYADTPCGPYDEMMLIPGAFDVPSKNKKRLRITRIYVSQKDTMYNGRVNWNIPKHLARFTFSSPPVSASNPTPKHLQISLFPPNPAAINPFFSATVQPFTFPPGLPLNTTWLPSYYGTTTLPPLPSALSALDGAWSADDEQIDVMYAPGTDEWCEFSVIMKSRRARCCWVKVEGPEAGSEEEAEAQRWWPQGKKWKPWAVGLWMENADLEITEGIKWKS
ncbi:hypothetical protein BT63DRAFT_80795 [Microthyrium microscopicum]|uniref:Uncharacterized protein n=1 Tax=Microthyrium microscopicum TaxID=703497 RepID=A0A6A6U104_9PEZI|nr:hypothetical protein BT63DRAFT_80795 [Microthyrium microscopicum]